MGYSQNNSSYPTNNSPYSPNNTSYAPNGDSYYPNSLDSSYPRPGYYPHQESSSKSSSNMIKGGLAAGAVGAAGAALVSGVKSLAGGSNNIQATQAKDIMTIMVVNRSWRCCSHGTENCTNWVAG